MDGLKKGMEAKMNGMEAKMDGMKDNIEDWKKDMEIWKEVLTKLLQKRFPNGKKVVEKTQNEKKINVNHD